MRGKRAAVVVGRATATRRRMARKAVVRREMMVWVVVAGVVSLRMRRRGVGCEVVIGVAAVGLVPPQMHRREVGVILGRVVVLSGVVWERAGGPQLSAAALCAASVGYWCGASAQLAAPPL